MSRFLVRAGVLVLAFFAPAAAIAQGVAIDHKEIGCIVAGKYPKMNACFTPASAVKKARVYFRPETLSTWYYVDMVSDAPCYSVALARPGKILIDKRMYYYVDVQGIGSARTPEYAPLIVASAEDCKSRLPVAPLSATGPAAVFPSLPGGGLFLGAGLSSPAVVAGGVAAAALVAGGAVALTNENTPEPPPPPPPSVVVTNPPATPSPLTPSPVIVPPGGPLAVACQATPRTGDAPLRVDFATFSSGGTGTYEFLWSFGDGDTSANPNPAHTFLSAGVFNATVRVASGAEITSCSRPITVTTPPTAPPPTAPTPPTTFKLTVGLTGSGTGTVTGPGVNCPVDCNETYPAGTVVTLTATPDSASTFIGWSGACSGTGPCTLAMNADQSVTARFEPKLTTATLTVAITGSGTGSVTAPLGIGINCPGDCTETYPTGTVVTLTATPARASTFMGWSGACSGTGPCTVTMNADQSVTAKFDLTPIPFTLTVAIIGSGTVTDLPGTGINCPTDCTETYPAGTVISLTATPTVIVVALNIFRQWTGDCTGTVNPCVLAMDGNKSVTAEFGIGPPPSSFLLSGIGRPPTSLEPGLGVSLSTTLEVPDGEGQVILNGRIASAVTPGLRAMSAEGVRGANRVEAMLVRGAGRSGTWRFDFSGQAAFKRGSLRVVAGTVALLTGDTVVFRLQGKPSERIVFSFEVDD
jgi:hypothetical protein